MSELGIDYELVLRAFITKHLDEVADRDGNLVAFDAMEPYLQDYCSDTGVCFMSLVEWLIDEGYLAEEEV